MTRRTVASALSETYKRLDEDTTLTPEMREQIKIKAREHVANKRRDKAEADYLAKSIREEEISHNPLEQYEDVTINIAPFVAVQKFGSSFISLDGTMYVHGLTYSVSYAVARTLEDIMSRGWEHEREIKGERRREDVNRRPLNATISPRSPGVSAVNTRRSVLNPGASI